MKNPFRRKSTLEKTVEEIEIEPSGKRLIIKSAASG